MGGWLICAGREGTIVCRLAFLRSREWNEALMVLFLGVWIRGWADMHGGMGYCPPPCSFRAAADEVKRLWFFGGRLCEYGDRLNVCRAGR